MNPDAHPADCLICGVALPPRDEPRGRPRLYCGTTCRNRARDLAELERFATTWEARERADVAARIRERAATKRRAWKTSA